MRSLIQIQFLFGDAEPASDPTTRPIATGRLVAAISAGASMLVNAFGYAGTGGGGAVVEFVEGAGFGLGEASGGAFGSAEVHVAVAVGGADCLGCEVHRAFALAVGIDRSWVRVRNGARVRKRSRKGLGSR